MKLEHKDLIKESRLIEVMRPLRAVNYASERCYAE